MVAWSAPLTFLSRVMPLGLAALVKATVWPAASMTTVAGPLPGAAPLMVRVVVQNDPGAASVTTHWAPRGVSATAREKAASLAVPGQSTVKLNVSPALPPVTVLATVIGPQLATWIGTGAIRSFNWASCCSADDDRLLAKTAA